MEDIPKAFLVCGFTQSRKTWKAFEIFNNITQNTNSVVFFITQSNCKMIVSQMIQRMKQDSDIMQKFPIVSSASEFGEELKGNKRKMIKDVENKNAIFVDFWHTNKMNYMIEIIKNIPWKNTTIVIDECDQGNYIGLKKRLEYLDFIDKTFDMKMRVIFITASVANFSNNILKIARKDQNKFTNGIIYDIIHTPCVALYFVNPSEEYVGPSYFIQEHDEKIKQVIFRTKKQR